MKILFTIILSFFLVGTSYSQNYKKVKIFYNNASELTQLQESSLEFDHFIFEKDNSISTFLSDSDFTKLQSTNLSYRVLIDDWNSYYESLPKLNETEQLSFIQKSKEQYNVEGFGYGSMGGFFTLDEINARLDSMYALYPNIISQKFSIGTTIQGRPIYAVKISDNPNVSENEPQVYYNALIHAREPQAMMSIMYYMYYLLENYGTDSEVTYLVNNREIYFQPVINPDGYEYNRSTNPNGGGMWRKNRKNNGDGSFGVDLNRNFGYQWGYNNSGSSPTPSSDLYRGSAPFSEPETQAMRNFSNSKNFKTALNYHTYGNLLLYPWGYENIPTPDNAIFVEYSGDMVLYNGYENGQPPVVLYDVNGSTDDWMYGEQVSKPKIFAMTPEVGTTGFWPSQAEIFPLAIENLMPNLYYTWVAGSFVSPVNPSFSQQFFNPGDNVEVIIPSFRNKGLSDAENITVTLSSNNPDISINNGSINLGNIPSRTSVNNSQNLSFSIGVGMPADINVKMLITILSSGTPMFVDTLSFITGTPVLVFADTTNDINTNWIITATPANPKWENTTSTYYSAPNSYTDSRIGEYVNNATVTLTSKNPIDLSQFQNPRLIFWTKYDIESNWDYGQVKISTNNGSTWIPLEGLYTEPGTGSFQPNGEPVYDGIQTSWVHEEISLSGYNSPETKLRFELRTDNSLTKDGWYLDDIGIVIYGLVPVELSSFTASATVNKVLLNWSTSSELNSQGFEIERKSTSSNSDWQKIGYVRGNGTTTDISRYTFTDENPIDGKSFYRLRQFDYDGSSRFFNSVEVNFKGITEYSLEQNYPNPFNPVTQISYSLPKAEYVVLKIYNILGSEVAVLENGLKEMGNYSISFNGSNLASGIYFYTLEAGNFKATKKMILTK